MERELTVPETYHASELIEQNGHLTYFAEHAVSISTFLDTQETRKTRACSLITIGSCRKNIVLLLSCVKVETSCALASENKDSYLLRRDTVWGCVQWKIACCSSWTASSAQITGREGPGVPCCGLKAKGVDTQSEMGNTTDDNSWEV